MKQKQNVDLTDNLVVIFEEPNKSQTFEMILSNNGASNLIIKKIKIDSPHVTVVNFNKKKEFIESGEKKTFLFESEFVSTVQQVKISFYFHPGTQLTRTVKIMFKESMQLIETNRLILKRNMYDIPVDLQDLICSERRITRTQLLDSLDTWASKIYTRQTYACHFHNLLYMEEIGLAKEMKEKYDKNSAYFGDKIVIMKIENGKSIRVTENYDEGKYDLTVNELFETRPSLQIGDTVIARKVAQPNIPYQGSIVEIKENDLIVLEFSSDFVEQFDHTAYVVHFEYSRSSFIRLHYAIDRAVEVFGIDFIMPTELTKRKKPISEISLDKNLNLIDSKMKLDWINKNLDCYQRQAVVNVLRGEYLNPYVIHGPPGTGKTTTLCEIVLQILERVKNSKIVIATQSNSAANLIAERLIESNTLDCDSLLRLNSITYHNRSTVPEALKDFSRTLDDLNPGEDFNINKCMNQVKKYRIVIGTSISLGKLIDILRKNFTHAIVDEAGQSTEMGVLIPMVLVGKHGQTIMAGDPMQMPPLVTSAFANVRGLAVSMLSRLLECYHRISVDPNQSTRDGSSLVSKLIRNYRALPSILDYYNKQFYKSELIATISAEGSREAKLLEHFCRIFTSFDSEYPTNFGLHFIDVDGKNLKKKNSWCNIAETTMIKALTENFMKLGLSEGDIGIITPYALQARAIEFTNKSLDKPDIRVGTVEDFQGLERKVVLISTVRTCHGSAMIDVSRNLGFVQCPKRINVAMSRAQIMTIVVGKGALLSRDENWNELIETCKANKTYTMGETILSALQNSKKTLHF